MKYVHLLLFIFCCSILSSCNTVNLSSVSGLYKVPLQSSFNVALAGYWAADKPNPYAGKKGGTIHVAPLDVSLVTKPYPQLAPKMVPYMRDQMMLKMNGMLAQSNGANNTRWRLTSSASGADIRIKFAVVALRPHQPVVGVVTDALAFVTPGGIGSLVGMATKGNIVLECTIQNGRTGQMLLAFKDANRASLYAYHKESYQENGNVYANLRVWADSIAELCRESFFDPTKQGTLRQRMEDRSVWDGLKSRVGTAM